MDSCVSAKPQIRKYLFPKHHGKFFQVQQICFDAEKSGSENEENHRKGGNWIREVSKANRRVKFYGWICRLTRSGDGKSP